MEEHDERFTTLERNPVSRFSGSSAASRENGGSGCDLLEENRSSLSMVARASHGVQEEERSAKGCKGAYRVARLCFYRQENPKFPGSVRPPRSLGRTRRWEEQRKGRTLARGAKPLVRQTAGVRLS